MQVSRGSNRPIDEIDFAVASTGEGAGALPARDSFSCFCAYSAHQARRASGVQSFARGLAINNARNASTDCGRIPRILVQAEMDRFLQFSADRMTGALAWRHGLDGHLEIVEFHHRIGFERVAAGQKLVGERANGVDVAAGIAARRNS